MASLSGRISAFTTHRPTQRQIARALTSGGYSLNFLKNEDEIAQSLKTGEHDALVLDCDNGGGDIAVRALGLLASMERRPPIILLSVAANKGPILELISKFDLSNLVAKHGALRAVYPVVDEHELLVTCNKVILRDIFGIDKYVGLWGVKLFRTVLTGLDDKKALLSRFEQYVRELDCPSWIVSDILTVADELIINAIVHAPIGPDGAPKYEAAGPTPGLRLEPGEFVEVAYGCDGQRLMLSVSDNFGRLTKRTLYDYLARSFATDHLVPETKASGAGLGLTMTYRAIHQLIFNIQDRVRTEAIAGWFIRVNSGTEFRQVGKSLNVFWLPKDVERSTVAPVVYFAGSVDESTDFEQAGRASILDLRKVKLISSRGVMRWLAFVDSVQGRQVELRACPEAMVRLALSVKGMLRGLKLATVLALYQCERCHAEETSEVSLADACRLEPNDGLEAGCSHCGGALRLDDSVEDFRRLAEIVAANG